MRSLQPCMLTAEWEERKKREKRQREHMQMISSVLNPSREANGEAAGR